MIKKIVKIKSVGKFVDYSAVGDVDFRKVNLIHGENSKGKTTLTSIFRSLKNKDVRFVSVMKTIGSNSEQEISILVNGDTKPLTFKNGSWNKELTDLEIFDVHFINENVYSGLEIDPEHKKCLHNFVLGTQSRALATKINNIKYEIEKSNDKLRILLDQIQPYIRGIYTIEDFIRSGKDPVLDKKIADKEKAIEIVESKKPILENPELEKIPSISFGLDISKTNNLLQETITTIQSQYLRKVDEHKKHLNFVGTEEWIRAGFENIKDNKCPFCSQSLEGTQELITAYTQFFNEEYNDLKIEVGSLLNQIKTINVDSFFSQRELLVSRNKERCAFWKKYLQRSYKDDGLFAEKDQLMKAYKAVLAAVESKSNNLLDAIDDKKGQELTDLLKTINKKFEEHNQEIELYNQEIRKLKNNPSENLGQLKIELIRLQVQKTRHEQEVENLCKKYIDEEKTQQSLNKTKDEKQKDLNQLIKDVFEKYETYINQYLEKFGTDFRIEKIKGGNYKGTSREPYVEYVVKIADCDLNFEEDGVNPCIKYALGEGDKAALAFAFFLAKLDVDGCSDKKIVIFDDPLSSFDENRKSATLEQLHRLSKSVKQLIILTHNPLIAREFFQGLENDGICKTLHIVRKGQSSCIEECSLIEETAGTYYQNYKTLEKFIKSGDSTQDGRLKTAQCIRPLLEGYLRNKFPGMFDSKEWLGDFIDKIKTAKNQEPMSFVKSRVTELGGLNDYSKRFHHDTNPNLASQTVVDTELSNYAKKTLNFIYQ